MHTRARDWAFTSYKGNAPNWDEKTMSFICYQLEKCPTTDRLHWQGAVQLIKGRTLKGVQKAIGDNVAHVSILKSSIERNREYCSKDETAVPGTYFEAGQPKGSGKQKGEGCLNRAIECSSLSEVAIREPKAFVLYNRGLERLFDERRNRRNWIPEVLIFWGPTGCGKTLTAFNMCPEAFWLMPPSNRKVWWDGYHGHGDVVIDEFNPGDWDISYVLRMLDAYPFRVEIKGGSAEFLARRIIITSHFDPWDWFPGRTDELMRRVSGIREFGLEKDPFEATLSDQDIDDFLASL